MNRARRDPPFATRRQIGAIHNSSGRASRSANRLPLGQYGALPDESQASPNHATAGGAGDSPLRVSKELAELRPSMGKVEPRTSVEPTSPKPSFRVQSPAIARLQRTIGELGNALRANTPVIPVHASKS